MKYFFLVMFLLVSLTCGAAIYMQKDVNGNVTYSDMPVGDATRVDLPPINTTTITTASPAPIKSKTKNTSKATQGTPEAAETHVEYTAFFISSPTEQQTFQNQREVAVEVSITPALQKGDTIQLLVDGTKLGEPATTTNFQVNQLPRGTHQVSATLLDENKTIIKQSPAINFFVRYAAVGAQQAN